MTMLSPQHTATLLPYPDLVVALRAAALEVAAGRIACPQRQVMAMGEGGTLLSMVAVGADVAVHKLVTVVPRNPQRGLPTIQGQVTVLNSPSGELLLTLDGATVTGRRTAALSMLGILTLLRHPPLSLRIYGTGTQSLHHLQAISALFPGARVQVVGRTRAASARFCEAHAQQHALLAPAGAQTAADDANVIITCTTSAEPVYTEAARSGRLVVAVGAFTPGAAEVAAATVRGSALYVDDLVNARDEAGDLIRAGVDWAQVEPLSGALSGNGPPSGAVLFKTVGSAAWDLAAARVALRSRAVTDLSHSAANVAPPSAHAAP